MKKGFLTTKVDGTTYRLQGIVFNINESSDTCSMKFLDGAVATDIPLSKIQYINSNVNEGLRDSLRKFSKKVADKVSFTFKKIGDYIFSLIGKDNILPAISPINTAIAYDKGELVPGILVMPSESLRDAAADYGINLQGASSEDVQDNEDALSNDVENLNDFWHKVMAEDDGKNKIVESFATVQSSRLNEIYDVKYGIAEKLGSAKYYEMFEKYSLEANERTNMPNRDYDQVKEMVMEAYYERITKGDDAKMLPIMIWGAPGIGKTSIIKDLIYQMNQELGFKGTMIEIDATSINPDDFSLPAIDRENNVARDIPKTWFPAYKRTTDEEANRKADAIANGAIDENDDSAAGGIIFIDEFSRIRKATMQVLMKLVDQRSINDLRLGSKWLIVCAGNREEDMGGDSINWQMAWGSRYLNVNYVPDFQHWVEWAENAGVEQDIIRFLRLNQGLWYDVTISDDQTNFANPRTWKSFSDTIKAKREFRKAMGYRNPEPSDADKVVLAGNAVGNKAADALQGYYKLYSKFSPNDAKLVWEDGANAPINFRLDSGNVYGALETILENHPAKLTEANINNLYAYILRLYKEMGNDFTMYEKVNELIFDYIIKLPNQDTKSLQNWLADGLRPILQAKADLNKSARSKKI